MLPLNPSAVVDRTLQHFNLDYDAQVILRIGDGGQTSLPINTPVMAGELLASYVELSQVATRKIIDQLAASSVCPPERDALKRLADDPATYQDQVLSRRLSVLDLIEAYPSVQLTLASYLQLLNPLAPRQYSISSSPQWSRDHCTLTVSVLREPALSGTGTYEGAASTYLAQARSGSRVAVSVRPSNIAFHPPRSLATPIVMVAAGSGVAPFRGFLQDRALRAQAENVTPATALLFYGCQHVDVDLLYRDELQTWADQGLLDLRPAFSRGGNAEVRYVQDRLWQDRADVVDLVRHNATFYICGDGQRMAPAVHDTCARIYAEATGATRTQADEWLDTMQRQHGRYIADVYS